MPKPIVIILSLGLLAAACTTRVPIGGAVCPCPAGYCCYGGVCVASGGVSCELVSRPGQDGMAPHQDGAVGGPDSTVSPASCPQAPLPGEACSPACQTGCSAGRCTVVAGHATCVPNGGVAQPGEICAGGVAPDECAAGSICRAETCGHAVARCYKLCFEKQQCGGDRLCNVPIDDATNGGTTPYSACDLGPSVCNPVARTGCLSPALTCFAGSDGQTYCDCPTGAGHVQDPCALYSDCSAGLVCLGGANGALGPSCQRLCETASPSCPNGEACVSFAGPGSAYGFCSAT
jgi:hypothetical protein